MYRIQRHYMLGSVHQPLLYPLQRAVCFRSQENCSHWNVTSPLSDIPDNRMCRVLCYIVMHMPIIAALLGTMIFYALHPAHDVVTRTFGAAYAVFVAYVILMK